MLSNQDTIVVLLRAARDPRVPGAVGRSGFGVRKRDLRYMLNPSDQTALQVALTLKQRYQAAVIGISYGAKGEDILRSIRGCGLDRLIYVDGVGAEGSDTMEEAHVLANITRKLAPKLICTGNSLADRGASMAAAVAASMVGQVAVHSVLADEEGQQHFEFEGPPDSDAESMQDQETLTVLRKSDRGGRQKVCAPLPCTLLFEAVPETGSFLAQPATRLSVDELIGGLEQPIDRWSPADLALVRRPTGRNGQYTSWQGTSRLRPRAVAVTTPDPALPAFDRILSLLEGGIKSRQGKLRFLAAEQTAEQLLVTIRQNLVEPEKS